MRIVLIASLLPCFHSHDVRMRNEEYSSVFFISISEEKSVVQYEPILLTKLNLYVKISIKIKPSCQEGSMKRAQKSTVLDIRRANRSSVLRRIYLAQSMSRQELSQHSGLSSASITNVVAELLEEGIVIEAGIEASQGGRPRSILSINPRYGYFISQISLIFSTHNSYSWVDGPVCRSASTFSQSFTNSSSAMLSSSHSP